MHVVGLSMGGMVAVDLAVRHAEHVASAVFLSAMSPDPQAGMGPRFLDGIGADPVIGTLASMGAASDEDERWMRGVATAQGGPHLGRTPRSATSRPPCGSAGRRPTTWRPIAAPTLVVHGAVDLVLPARPRPRLGGRHSRVRACISWTAWGICRRGGSGSCSPVSWRGM